jgi:ATP-dependent RNA helicase DDX18/HAS1
MGIKGKRRKQRLRDEQNREAGGDAGDAGNGHIDPEMLADPELRELARAGQLPPGIVLQSHMKMKKSELYALQDQDVLDDMRERHAQRKKQPNLGGADAKKKNRAETDQLAATAEAEDVFGDGLAGGQEEAQRQEQRNKKIVGPSFADPLLGLRPEVVDALVMAGFHCMTRIQSRAVPLALQSYDILGQAKTGSGKTLAFGIPIINSALDTLSRAPNTFVALILSPTKELCAQICSVLENVTKYIGATSAGGGKKAAGAPRVKAELITGGTKVQEERRRLLACHIAVGTPGRVLDHAQHTPAWTIRTTLTHFVMDEADRLLADGFQRDLDAILAALPAHRQTMLFSATNSKSVRDLARLSLSQSPIFVSTKGDAPQALDGSDAAPPYTEFEVVDGDGGDGAMGASSSRVADEEAIPSALKQYAQVVPVHERLRALYVFVKRVCKTRKAMVFCSTVASAQFHCMVMGAAGFHNEVLMLHGKMKHRQRLATFDAFLRWDSGVLFCTDVAARGLDIPHVDWILQYDAPTDPTEYIHRIGRTARAGAVGSALLFVSPEETPFVSYLAKYGIRMDILPQEPVPDIQLSLQRILELDPIVAGHAVSAFRAHVAAYQSHVLTAIFDVRRLNLEDLAICYALTNVPSVSLPKSTAEEKKADYVKGKLKSLQKRSNAARAEYERFKTKPQWSEEGAFVGMSKPESGP